MSERLVRTIGETVFVMWSGADLDGVIWGDTDLTVTFLININPIKALKRVKTPYEIYHNKKTPNKICLAAAYVF